MRRPMLTMVSIVTGFAMKTATPIRIRKRPAMTCIKRSASSAYALTRPKLPATNAIAPHNRAKKLMSST
jgi:hypothetical protein